MKVFVAGSGVMGMGIVQVFALAGNDVVLYDVNMEIVEKGLSGLERTLSKLVEKGKLEESVKSGILGRITKTDKLEAAADCNLVVEAIIENAAIKKDLFAKLDAVCKDECVFTTNTSSISVTELASATKRADRFAGMHFFNPAAVMKLVEVIRGVHTSDAVFEKVFGIACEIGKEAVEVSEAPGFVVNKILVPMINEAVCVLEQGVASAEDIDKAMKLGAGHPMGPLALADLIGNDVVLSIMDTLYQETGDPKYRASVLLRKMVRSGKLGRKTGSGFFAYDK